MTMQAFLDLDDLWSTTIEIADGATADAEKDRKARNRLILSVAPICHIHVKGVTTAKAMWKKLCEAYEDKGLCRRVGLLRKLLTTTLASSGSMEQLR